MKEVRRIAGEKQPLDLALDAVGGRSFRKSFSLLRPGGRLVCFGASEVQSGERRKPLRALRTLAEMPRHNVLRLMSQSKSVIGLNMLVLWDSKQSLDEYVEPLTGWLEQGDIRPVVAQTFAARGRTRRAPLPARAPQRGQGRAGAVMYASSSMSQLADLRLLLLLPLRGE